MAADKDQDGMLTEADMTDVFESFDLPSTDASIFFKENDKDGQGQVWWREIFAALAPSLNGDRSL
jgi:Ca2+-binding EF-hand superfamily protein